MTITFILILVGIVTGVLIEKNKKLVILSGNLLFISIYLLLFFLGISIGKNQILINGFLKIGFKSFIIAMFGILGSITSAYIFERIFFEKK